MKADQNPARRLSGGGYRQGIFGTPILHGEAAVAAIRALNPFLLLSSHANDFYRNETVWKSLIPHYHISHSTSERYTGREKTNEFNTMNSLNV